MKKTILTALIITAILLSCNDDKTPDPVLCDCAETYGTTAHLGIDEDCPCDADEKPCGCTEQTAALDGIAIRKQAGISVAQMNTAVANINTAYYGNGLADTHRIRFKNNVTQILIVSGNGVTLEGTVSKVGIGATVSAIEDHMLDDIQ
jgi:uncharacterized lipoprotein NlpE involved in copper resistance